MRHLIPLCLFLGLVLRIYFSTFGANYDALSFWLVANTILKGHSVYETTARYNYGPIWFLILGGLEAIVRLWGPSTAATLHILVATLLSGADLLLYWLLSLLCGPVNSLLFYLNPVSILSTGFHSHFDNLALVFALYGWTYIRDDDASGRARCLAGLFIGLSLATKHLLFLFPVWLLLVPHRPWRERNWQTPLIAYLVFLATFIPFSVSAAGRQGILNHVFRYRGVPSESLLKTLFTPLSNLPDFLITISFLLLLTAVGYAWGKQPKLFRLGLPLYLVALVALSPAMADQYLVIPLLALAYFPRSRLLWIYTFVSTIFLFVSEQNVGFYLQGITIPTQQIPYYMPQLLLLSFLMLILRPLPVGGHLQAARSRFIDLHRKHEK